MVYQMASQTVLFVLIKILVLVTAGDKYPPDNLLEPNSIAFGISGQLDHLTAENLKDGDVLFHMNISFNRIKDLPEDVFTPTPNLRVLYMSHNQLQNLPGGLFSSNPALETVDFSKNQLQNLPDGLFTNNRALETVNFSKNLLQHLPDELFSNNPALVTVNFSKNQLQHLPDRLFSNSPPSVLVDFSYNQIRTIDRGLFFAKSSINSIDFANNSLTAIDPDAFSNTSVRFLNLSNNNLTRLGLEFLRKMPYLEVLVLSGNCVGNPEPRTLAKNQLLEKLYLANCCLTNNFRYGAFPHKTLRELDLSDNPLTYIDAKPLINTRNLQKLVLRGMIVEKTYVLTFSQISSLREIELEQGGYRCNQLEIILRELANHNVELIITEPNYDTDNINGFACQD